MYRRYFNESEKRGQQITESSKNSSISSQNAQSPPKNTPDPPKNISFSGLTRAPLENNPAKSVHLGALGKLRIDDILLIIIIWLLLKEEKKDMWLILALGFIFISDFNLL